jgi:hypothetical protein
MLMLAINLANVLTSHYMILSFSGQNGTNEKLCSDLVVVSIRYMVHDGILTNVDYFHVPFLYE